MIMEKGRICVKISGRDAGSKCVIVEVIDSNFVKIVSQVRKNPRKCAITQLEPTEKVVAVSTPEEALRAL